jgi:hypothetical protein
MGKAIRSLFVLGFIGLFLYAGVMMALGNVRNTGHADAKHLEAPVLRATFQKSSTGAELYFSPSRGTILALFVAEGAKPDEIGGIVWRVTENNGTRWLGEEAYECTAFVSTRAYWNNVIKRDGYAPLVGFPNIEQAYWNWILAQFN